jgi:diguanylate cyclase (GGDEF)-like protein
MLGTIEQRDIALHEANLVLETRVAERTADLVHKTRHDSLTELANRSFFMERLAQAVIRARQVPTYCYSVMFVDVDRFKTINDSIGHVAGDEIIRGIADRLSRAVRNRGADPSNSSGLAIPGDVVARIGGDEFVILLDPVVDASDPVGVAERIIVELALPFVIQGQPHQITTSIGIALGSAQTAELKDVLSDADTAMYKAKGLGFGRYQVCDQEMHKQAVSRITLENDLKRAVELEQFRVFYQPVVSLETCRTVGFEALVRWDHPQSGLVSPADFISIAEETGLIVPLGNFVLRAACRQLMVWNERFSTSLHVAVNVSAKQFAEPGFAAHVGLILSETGLPPKRLTIEITESITMGDADRAAYVLQQLRDLGVSLSCDDFGTGFSSLSYLHRFPLDTLKIDRSFLSEVSHSGDSRGIVESIVSLGHALGMGVVAEGVESQDHVDWLKSLRCEYAQGYYFSKPLPADRITAAIEAELAAAGDLAKPLTLQQQYPLTLAEC